MDNGIVLPKSPEVVVTALPTGHASPFPAIACFHWHAAFNRHPPY